MTSMYTPYFTDCSRLRTKPYLPPSQRPDVITTTKGVEINVDRAKVEVKEKVLRQGEVRWLTTLLTTENPY